MNGFFAVIFLQGKSDWCTDAETLLRTVEKEIAFVKERLPTSLIDRSICSRKELGDFLFSNRISPTKLRDSTFIFCRIDEEAEILVFLFGLKSSVGNLKFRWRKLIDRQKFVSRPIFFDDEQVREKRFSSSDFVVFRSATRVDRSFLRVDSTNRRSSPRQRRPTFRRRKPNLGAEFPRRESFVRSSSTFSRAESFLVRIDRRMFSDQRKNPERDRRILSTGTNPTENCRVDGKRIVSPSWTDR